MNVELLAYTPNADNLCSAAGQSCYSEDSAGEIMCKNENPAKILKKIVGMGHHSVIEHAVFSFSVQGVSRTLTHQLVRHRIASFSQQSQRYVSMTKASYVTPPSVTADKNAADRYHALMDEVWSLYAELSEILPKEDARYVLPNACHTNIVITMNARELWHFFSLRCCHRAQWEIRDMASKMMELCQQVSPTIFKDAGPPCARGPCPEGKLSCGKPWGNEKKLK